MANEGNEDQNRRMDLNLYLGLPHSPRRSELDLGSDLALGSLPIQIDEEILASSRQISSYVEASASHAPYSPSNASYTTPNTPALGIEVETLDPIENLPFTYSASYSSPPSYPIIPQSTQSGGESLVRDAAIPLDYRPYSPSYSPVSPTRQAGTEPLEALIDHVPYSPSYVPVSTIEQDSIDAIVRDVVSNHGTEYVPYSPTYIPALSSPSNEPLVHEDNPHIPYIPVSPTTQVHTDNFSRSLPEAMRLGSYQSTDQIRDGSFQQELLQCPEFRIRRLIDSHHHHRLHVRRFRSTVPYRVPPELGAFSLASHSFSTVPSSERSTETNNGNQKMSVEALVSEDLEDGMKEQSSGAANFDCNICLDVAKEPVVTSCGHLFCWPCLYQWLHFHCDYKECPVCKGEVTESDITPIYGRGSSETGIQKEHEHEEGNSGLKVPPRPRGHRFDSLRQRIRRPLSRARRLGEENGSWRLIMDEDMRNGHRVEGLEEPSMQEIFDESSRRMRFMASRRSHRRGNLENGLNMGGNGSSRNASEMASDHTQNNVSLPDVHIGGSRNTPPAIARHGIDHWPRYALYSAPISDRLAALAADFSGTTGRMRNNVNHSGSSSSVNPQQESSALNVQGTPDVFAATDQASASSTMAVIQGDTGVPVDAPVEPNSVGSSHTLRRRRYSASSSLDVDGVQHARKRRRLN